MLKLEKQLFPLFKYDFGTTWHKLYPYLQNNTFIYINLFITEETVYSRNILKDTSNSSPFQLGKADRSDRSFDRILRISYFKKIFSRFFEVSSQEHTEMVPYENQFKKFWRKYSIWHLRSLVIVNLTNIKSIILVLNLCIIWITRFDHVQMAMVAASSFYFQ